MRFRKTAAFCNGTGCDWLTMKALRSALRNRRAQGDWVVRIVELSNHPGAMLQEASQHRAATGERAQAQFEAELAQHHRRVEDAHDARDRARVQRRWWAWLRLALAVRRE